MKLTIALIFVAGCDVLSAIHHAGYADCEIYDLGSELGLECEDAELCFDTDGESMFFDEHGRKYDCDHSLDDCQRWMCRWCNFPSIEDRDFVCK